jgi:signal transduction histidine kinase/ligand-binding sensor domain-containing protein
VSRPPTIIGWLATCAFAFFLAIGQAVAEYRFDVWTTDSGLPHNTVRGVVQSQDGYLWVGTLDGLARFDGVRFTVFNKANSPGLPNNRITALHGASDGALWMGFEDGGVARYQHGRFTSFGAKDGLPAMAVAGIGGDDDGNPWVLSQALLLRLQDGRFRPDFPKNAAGLFPRPGIGWNNEACIWMRTPDALHIVSRGKLTTLGLSNGLPSLKVSLISEDPPGTWWMATEDAGVLKFRDGKVVKRFTQQDGLPRDRVAFGPEAWSSPKLCEDRKGNLWLTGAGPWLGRLKEGVFFAYSPTNTPTLQVLAQATTDHINALYEDAEGNLWIATERTGLIRARQQVMNMISSEQGLKAVNIYPVYEDRTGAVWLGNWSHGLARVASGVVTNFPYSPQHRLVTALCEDRAGQLWVASYGPVSIFQNGTLTKAGVPTGLTNGVVHVICQDRSGALWFGADRGLSRYQDGRLSFFTEKDGLAGRSISVIIEDRAGALWMGGNGGLSRWANGRFTAWTERDGLPSNHVRALYEDSDDTLWIGSADGGLGRFKAGKFTRYTTREGLFDDGVFQILEDARGNFWMSSNRGIHRVNKRDLNELAEGRRRNITSVAYGKDDGMLDAECNGGRWPAGVKTRDSKLWFPTQNGVAVIDPAALSANLKPPRVVIEAALLDREPQALDRPLRVLPDKANIEIHYTGLSFINSEWLSFKYRLAGVDDDWIEVGRRRTAYYSHIAPGRYTFTVLAANSDGVWNETGASLAFIVVPAWYQAGWFRALTVAALAGVAFSFYRARIVRLQREQATQQEFSRGLIESQEQERKRIAAELHDSLGQNLLVIKSRIAMAKSPDASNSQELDEIVRLTQQSIEEVREISQNLRPYQLDRLGLTRALHSLVKKVSASCQVKCAADITPVDRVFSSEAETNLFRIVQEALNNVLKHSGATEARVVVERNDARVRLLIEDNGRGFDWPGKQGDGAHGMGLSGIAERVRILHGRLEIHSAPGHGTRLKIEAPIPADNK